MTPERRRELLDASGVLDSLVDAVERPCMSHDVGAPGSAMRRANDLGRRLHAAERERDDARAELDDVLVLTSQRDEAVTAKILADELYEQQYQRALVAERERDEARAKLDEARDEWGDDNLNNRRALERAEKERDEARAKLDEARALLREIEEHASHCDGALPVGLLARIRERLSHA